jgi:hypothetical protein
MSTTLTSTVINSGTPGPHGKGVVTRVRVTWPTNTTECKVPVGNLSASDLVEILPQQAVTSNIGFVHVAASDTVSNEGRGLVDIKRVDGTQGPAGTTILEVVVYRNI